MTPDQQYRLAAFLSDELGEAVEITDVRRIGTGHSRAMYALTTHNGHRLVARIEQGGVFGTKTSDEVACIAALFAAGVPVAPPIAIDLVGHVVGTPMFVMDFVEGVDTLVAPPAAVDDFIVQLDALHHLDNSSELALSGRDQVDVWLDRASVVEPSALLLEAAAWLHTNRPESAISTAPIHGDAGPGNFVHDGEHLLIFTDWEFAHLGDPAEDWAFVATMRGHREMSAAAWRTRIAELTGWATSDEEWRYWEALNLFKGACANITAFPVFEHGTTPTPDLLAVGTAMHHVFLKRVADIVHGNTGNA